MSRPIGITRDWRRDAAERGILLRPLSARLGSEVVNVDPRCIREAEVLTLLCRAGAERGILVFRGWRELRPADLEAFARAVDGAAEDGSVFGMLHSVGRAALPAETCFVDTAALARLHREQAKQAPHDAAAAILRLRLSYTHRWRAGDILLVEDRCRPRTGRRYEPPAMAMPAGRVRATA